MALPFLNYDPEALQYEFDIILFPELKVRGLYFSHQIFKNCNYSSVDKSFTTSKLTLYQIVITQF